MSAPPILRARYVKAFQRGLAELDLSANRALSIAQISEQQINNPNNCIPLAQLGLFATAAVKQHGCWNLGFIAGILPRKNHSTFSLRTMSRPTFYETLHYIRSNAHMEDTSAVYHMISRADSLWLHCDPIPGRPEAVRQIELFRFAALLEVIRHTAGPDWIPENLWLQQAYDSSLQDQPLLRRINIRFASAGLAIEIPVRLLNRSPDTDHITENSGNLRAPADTTASVLPVDYVDAIMELIRNRMGHVSLRVEDIAQSIDVSPRTLQRNLALWQTSFSQLVEQVRVESARKMLTQTDLAIGEISRELGYSYGSHFSRAFYRACGTTPRRYRAMERS